MKKRILSMLLAIAMVLGMVTTVSAADPAVTKLTVGGVNALTTTSGTNWSYDGVDTLTLSGDVGTISATGDLKIRLEKDVTITTSTSDEPIKVYGSLTIDATGHTLTLDAVAKNRIALHVAKYDSGQTADLTVTGGKVVACSGQTPIENSGNLTIGDTATLIAYYPGSNKGVALKVGGNIFNNGNIICNAKIRFNNSNQMSTVTNNGNLYYNGNNCVDSSNLTVLNNSLIVTGVTAYDTATNTVSIGGSAAVIDVKGNVSLSCNLMIPEGETAILTGDSVLTVPAETTFTNQGTLVIKESASISGTIIGNQPEAVGYMITFDANVVEGGWLTPSNMPAVQNVAPGNKATVPEDPIDGRGRYAFAGWYTDPECTQKYDFDTIVTKSMTLYAKWGWSIADAAIVFNPESGIYDGNAFTPSVTVTMNSTSLVEDLDYTVSYTNNVNAGQATVTVTGIGNYVGTKTAVFSIAPMEMDETNTVVTLDQNTFVYDGQPHKPTVAVSFNGTTLREGVDYEVLYLVAMKTSQGKPIKWFGTGETSLECINANNAYYAVVMGKGNYYTANNLTLCANFVIAKADQAAPTGLTKTDTTYFGKADGKISGLTSAMEFRKEGDSAYTAGFNGNLEYLAAGTYYVRYQGDANHNPSPDAVVTVNAGRKLQIVVPQNQVGYTVTVNKTEMEYEGSYTLKVEINEGYTATEDFKIIISNWECGQQAGVEETYMNAIADQIIEVRGVADVTPPAAEIKVKENSWTSFLNNITFGLFFKETQDVTITVDDAGSGVKSIQYYLYGRELKRDEVRSITDWIDYNGTFKINPDNRYVVYAKITDNAGNVEYINSEGIVLDATAPVLYGIEDGGIYHGDKVFKAMDENFLKIEVDGVDITDTTEGDAEFKIAADNAEHTVTVTDKAGNVTEYKITVYKKYMVTYTDGEGGSYEKNFNYGEVITIPTNEFFKDTFRKTGYTVKEWQGYTEGMTMPLSNLTFTAVYVPCEYTVTFDQNGGEVIDPITVTFGEKYGSLPSSAITGLSGGNKNWYLVDADGNVTETNIKNLTLVSTARDHKLFIKRNVLAPSVSLALTVPGGISDGYQYYIPGASKRVLTATIGNMNTDILEYTYRWYKDGTLIEGATSNVLTLDGNVSDSGTYKVEVTVKLKDGTNIVVGSDTATASKEQKVKILHATNTLSYDANGGEGGPQSSYTGGTALNVSKDVPTRAHYDFIGWNTAPDGTGNSYKAEDAYTFVNDNGNGGCEVTLYAQWKLVEYTVTYKADGEPISTETVGHGKDANLPSVPAKDGYVGKWDSDGKNITEDTTINVVYTEIPVVKPDEVKPEDKTDLADTKAKLEEELKDDSYTDDDKKDIQDAIDNIDDALEVIGNVEAVEESISKLPAVDTVKPDDEEAIKAITDAQTAYNALSDYEKSLVDEATKANLDKLVAALVAYDIVEGDGSSWTEDSDHSITFVVNGLFSKFVGIKVDGKDVDKANYEVEAGSTIITLKASYLDTLKVGEHTITVLYTDGSTDGTFNVHAKANSPATGDDFNIALYGSLMAVSVTALVVLLLASKKRKQAK